MKLTNRQRDVLVGVLVERDSLAATAPRFGRERRYVTERLAIQDAQDGLVQCHPSLWLGVEMTSSLSTMVSRTYEQLERRGLIERHRLGHDSARTSHLSLTATGEALAKLLIAADCGMVESSGSCVTGALPKAPDSKAIESKDPTTIEKEKLPPSATPQGTGAEHSDQEGPVSDSGGAADA